MTDRSPLDDELVSAVLDGEATAEERALVEGSVEGRRRLAELRAASELVAGPPIPLDGATVDALVGRALESAASVPWSVDADELARQRARRMGAAGGWRRALTVAAAAVAFVVVVGGLAVTLVRSESRDSASDSASELSTTADDQAASPSTLAGESAGAGTADTTSPVPVDLGPLPDAAAVLARVTALQEADPTFDGRSASSGPDAADPSNLTTPSAITACPVPPTPTRPGEEWAVVAVAQLPTAPVLVMADTAAGTLGRVVVVDRTTCTVVAEE